MTDVAELIVYAAAGNPPKLTPRTFTNPAPVMVTDSPPSPLPDAGLRLLMVGGGAVNVKWSPLVTGDMPLAVVTIRSTTPAASAGEVAVIDPVEFSVNELAGVLPKLTPTTETKLVPVIVTVVPPADGPKWGLTLITDGGGAMKSKLSALEFVG